MLTSSAALRDPDVNENKWNSNKNVLFPEQKNKTWKKQKGKKKVSIKC